MEDSQIGRRNSSINGSNWINANYCIENESPSKLVMCQQPFKTNIEKSTVVTSTDSVTSGTHCNEKSVKIKSSQKVYKLVKSGFQNTPKGNNVSSETSVKASKLHQDVHSDYSDHTNSSKNFVKQAEHYGFKKRFCESDNHSLQKVTETTASPLHYESSDPSKASQLQHYSSVNLYSECHKVNSFLKNTGLPHFIDKKNDNIYRSKLDKELMAPSRQKIKFMTSKQAIKAGVPLIGKKRRQCEYRAKRHCVQSSHADGVSYVSIASKLEENLISKKMKLLDRKVKRFSEDISFSTAAIRSHKNEKTFSNLPAQTLTINNSDVKSSKMNIQSPSKIQSNYYIPCNFPKATDVRYCKKNAVHFTEKCQEIAAGTMVSVPNSQVLTKSSIKFNSNNEPLSLNSFQETVEDSGSCIKPNFVPKATSPFKYKPYEAASTKFSDSNLQMLHENNVIANSYVATKDDLPKTGKSLIIPSAQTSSLLYPNLDQRYTSNLLKAQPESAYKSSVVVTINSVSDNCSPSRYKAKSKARKKKPLLHNESQFTNNTKALANKKTALKHVKNADKVLNSVHTSTDKGYKLSNAELDNLSPNLFKDQEPCNLFNNVKNKKSIPIRKKNSSKMEKQSTNSYSSSSSKLDEHLKMSRVFSDSAETQENSKTCNLPDTVKQTETAPAVNKELETEIEQWVKEQVLLSMLQKDSSHCNDKICNPDSHMSNSTKLPEYSAHKACTNSVNGTNISIHRNNLSNLNAIACSETNLHAETSSDITQAEIVCSGNTAPANFSVSSKKVGHVDLKEAPPECLVLLPEELKRETDKTVISDKALMSADKYVFTNLKHALSPRRKSCIITPEKITPVKLHNDVTSLNSFPLLSNCLSIGYELLQVCENLPNLLDNPELVITAANTLELGSKEPAVMTTPSLTASKNEPFTTKIVESAPFVQSPVVSRRTRLFKNSKRKNNALNANLLNTKVDQNVDAIGIEENAAHFPMGKTEECALKFFKGYTSLPCNSQDIESSNSTYNNEVSISLHVDENHMSKITETERFVFNDATVIKQYDGHCADTKNIGEQNGKLLTNTTSATSAPSVQDSEGLQGTEQFKIRKISPICSGATLQTSIAVSSVADTSSSIINACSTVVSSNAAANSLGNIALNTHLLISEHNGTDPRFTGVTNILSVSDMPDKHNSVIPSDNAQPNNSSVIDIRSHSPDLKSQVVKVVNDPNKKYSFLTSANVCKPLSSNIKIKNKKGGLKCIQLKRNKSNMLMKLKKRTKRSSRKKEVLRVAKRGTKLGCKKQQEKCQVIDFDAEVDANQHQCPTPEEVHMSTSKVLNSKQITLQSRPRENTPDIDFHNAGKTSILDAAACSLNKVHAAEQTNVDTEKNNSIDTKIVKAKPNIICEITAKNATTHKSICKMDFTEHLFLAEKETNNEILTVPSNRDRPTLGCNASLEGSALLPAKILENISITALATENIGKRTSSFKFCNASHVQPTGNEEFGGSNILSSSVGTDNIPRCDTDCLKESLNRHDSENFLINKSFDRYSEFVTSLFDDASEPEFEGFEDGSSTVPIKCITNNFLCEPDYSNNEQASLIDMKTQDTGSFVADAPIKYPECDNEQNASIKEADSAKETYKSTQVPVMFVASGKNATVENLYRNERIAFSPSRRKIARVRDFRLTTEKNIRKLPLIGRRYVKRRPLTKYISSSYKLTKRNGPSSPSKFIGKSGADSTSVTNRSYFNLNACSVVSKNISSQQENYSTNRPVIETLLEVNSEDCQEDDLCKSIQLSCKTNSRANDNSKQVSISNETAGGINLSDEDRHREITRAELTNVHKNTNVIITDDLDIESQFRNKLFPPAVTSCTEKQSLSSFSTSANRRDEGLPSIKKVRQVSRRQFSCDFDKNLSEKGCNTTFESQDINDNNLETFSSMLSNSKLPRGCTVRCPDRRTNPDGMYECRTCSKSFSSLLCLLQHVFVLHADVGLRETLGENSNSAPLVDLCGEDLRSGPEEWGSSALSGPDKWRSSASSNKIVCNVQTRERFDGNGESNLSPQQGVTATAGWQSNKEHETGDDWVSLPTLQCGVDAVINIENSTIEDVHVGRSCELLHNDNLLNNQIDNLNPDIEESASLPKHSSSGAELLCSPSYVKNECKRKETGYRNKVMNPEPNNDAQKQDILSEEIIKEILDVQRRAYNVSFREKKSVLMAKLNDDNVKITSKVVWINDQKRYQCDHCAKHFLSSEIWTKHMVSHYGPPFPTFKCPLCSKLFCHDSALKLHLEKHAGIKRFKCGLCDVGFQQEAKLRNHIQVHMKNKQTVFQCKQCNKKLKSALLLARHSKLHSNVLIYKCRTCSYSCDSRGKLYAHVKAAHGDFSTNKKENSSDE